MEDKMAAECGSTVRSTRKKKFALTQEEENDGGFRFTRRSKRLRKQNEPESIELESGPQVCLPSAQKMRSSKKQASSAKKPKREQLCENVEEIQTVIEKAEDLECAVFENVSKENTQKKQKKKRRSSFIRGRNLHDSLELYESEELASVKGLHKDIPNELNSEKRLLLLLEKSLQIMSERLKAVNCDDIPNFQETAGEFVVHLQETVQVHFPNGNQAEVQERVIVSNPKNEQLERYAKESGRITKRMTQEDKEWEELLDDYEKMSERQAEDTNDAITVDTLSKEQQQFLESLTPVQEMPENLETVVSKSFLMVDKMHKTSVKLKTFGEVADSYIDKDIKLLGKKSFKGIDGTPRHIIHGALGSKKLM